MFFFQGSILSKLCNKCGMLWGFFCIFFFQEYIRSLCNPEEAVSMKYPEDMHSLVFDRDVHKRIEKQSRAVVKPSDSIGQVIYIIIYCLWMKSEKKPI